MMAGRLFRGSLGRSLAELALIVVGVLLALWVDEWRGDFEEKAAVRQHLLGIVQEADANRWTLYKIRSGLQQGAFVALGQVIQTLDRPDPQVDDPEGLIRALMQSSVNPTPWFSRNSFESFRTSEAYHSDYVRDLASGISDVFEAPRILFEQPFADPGPYTAAVSGLVPARYQSEFNAMRFYVSNRVPAAPVIADDETLQQAVAAIVARRGELVRLARYQAERDTAKWYAITRIIWEFQQLKERIVAHPLLEGVEIPSSDDVKLMDAHKIVF